MADKKKKVAPKKTVAKTTTAKRRTALPVSAARATASKAPVMRIVKEVVAEPVLAAVIEPAHYAIAQRAFENWMLYLRLANDPVANWLEAEHQLRRESNPE